MEKHDCSGISNQHGERHWFVSIYFNLFGFFKCDNYFFLDDVFDIIITYLNNADDYDGPHKQISNIYDLQEIIKLAGMRCQFTSSPSTHVGKEATDVFKR